MSPEGFLRAVSTMNTLLNQLVKAGVVKQERRQKSDTAGT
jgi:predicted transcriptional regulator